MITSAHKGSSKNITLSDILKPVNSELASLEERISKNLSKNNPLLSNIIGHVIKAGGKRLRPAVCFLFAKALNKGYISSNHFNLGLALELVHTATLIHDDVIDETETRRNVLTVREKWNDKTAIIAGDFLLAQALAKLAAVKNCSVIEIFANTMSEICEGEVQQNSQSYEFISIDQYIDKSRRKTANLFVAGAECAAILTLNADNLIIKAARDYALNFGIAFQIVDDILNFTSTEEECGKPTGIDLKDGILTAPVLFAIEEYKQKGDSTLEELIKKGLEKDSDFKTALDLVIKSLGIQKTQELAAYYADLAIKSLDVLEDNPYKKALIDLSHFIIHRKY